MDGEGKGGYRLDTASQFLLCMRFRLFVERKFARGFSEDRAMIDHVPLRTWEVTCRSTFPEQYWVSCTFCAWMKPHPVSIP